MRPWPQSYKANTGYELKRVAAEHVRGEFVLTQLPGVRKGPRNAFPK